MKKLDTGLIGIVCLVWAALATMYATIPMIYMPSSFRVWGAGAFLFLVLAAVTAFAESKGKARRGSRDRAISR